jgi:hypothetical protein
MTLPKSDDRAPCTVVSVAKLQLLLRRWEAEMTKTRADKVAYTIGRHIEELREVIKRSERELVP